MKKHKVSIKILDRECRSYGMMTLVRKLEMDSRPELPDDHTLSDFLESVAFFRWHLKREHRLRNIEKKIKIEFSELVPISIDDDNDLFRQQYAPKIEITAGNETGTPVNLIREGKIELHIPDNFVDNQAMTLERYGLTIRSSAGAPLYVSVFFFSVGSFEIVSYYEPPLSGSDKSTVQPSIPANGVLPIGYGPGDLPAWHYGLQLGDEIDLGFLKFFISTMPIQLSHLVQASPFDRVQVRGPHRADSKPASLWSTITIPLVQRLAPTNKSLGSS